MRRTEMDEDSRNLTTTDVIRYLVIMDSTLSVEAIQAKLEQLGLPSCTSFFIAQTRKHLRDHLTFFKQVGVIDRAAHLAVPQEVRRELRNAKLLRPKAEELEEPVNKLRAPTTAKPSRKRRPRRKLKSQRLIERRCPMVGDD